MIISGSHSPIEWAPFIAYQPLDAIYISTILNDVRMTNVSQFQSDLRKDVLQKWYVWVLGGALCAPKHFQLYSVLLRPSLERILHSFPRAASKGAGSQTLKDTSPTLPIIAEIAAC